MIMVHYVRFLKTARVVNQTSTSICVRALATITTDLGDSFLASDAKLTSSLVAADDIGKVLCKNDILWQGGSRELPLEAVWHITGQNIPLLRLHVCHVKGRSSPIPSIVDAWSATFEPTPDFRSAALIERQLSLPCLPVLKVWEDTGNTISRHIW